MSIPRARRYPMRPMPRTTEPNPECDANLANPECVAFSVAARRPMSRKLWRPC